MVLTLDHGHEAEQEGQAEEEVQLHDQDPATNSLIFKGSDSRHFGSFILILQTKK